jgi:hypothetical protein
LRTRTHLSDFYHGQLCASTFYIRWLELMLVVVVVVIVERAAKTSLVTSSFLSNALQG